MFETASGMIVIWNESLVELVALFDHAEDAVVLFFEFNGNLSHLAVIALEKPAYKDNSVRIHSVALDRIVTAELNTCAGRLRNASLLH